MLVEKEVFIPIRANSQNDFHKRYWKKYYRIKKKWFKAIGFILGRGEHNDRKRSAWIIGYQPPRGMYDDQNFVGGCKPIPDALKEFGWIKDDNRKRFSCQYTQEKVGTHGTDELGVRIIILNLDFEWQEKTLYDDKQKILEEIGLICKNPFGV